MYYLKSFISEKDAVETMEWIAIVVVAAALIGIAVTCGDQIKAKLSAAVSNI